jgi:glycosyltransferase involved in cell wall biosynthesis
MKRILYIHHAGGIGGAPLSLLYLLRQLDRGRYEPVVVTLKPGPVVDLFRAEGIETRVEMGISDFSHTTLEWYGGWDLWRLPGKLLRIWPSILCTRELLRHIRPDIVHLNSSTLTPSAIGCAAESVPAVWHIREPLAQGYLGVRRAWIRRAVDRHAARVVAISRFDADQLRPSSRIRVIYNFVHFDQFDRKLTGDPVRREMGIPPDAPVVAMLGGVAPPKGALTLVQALPELVRRVPGVKVILAGPPLPPPGGSTLRAVARRVAHADSYEQGVRRAVNALDAASREALIFTGIRQDIPHLLAASQCLVFPSTVPHFARPIIEAAAMGVPSVASDLGGPRELIVPGQTGLLVPPGEPEQLAEAVAAVVSDPTYARSLGEAAYQRATALYDAKVNALQTIALYDEILGQ